MVCRHLQRSPEAYRIALDGAAAPAVVLLCGWADSAPPQLVDVPRWMQREALGGHLWREGDCDKCPCFEADR